MDRKRYEELQYLTLRKEIEDSLRRSFVIMIGGAMLIPALVGLIAHYAPGPILATLPMMVVVIALLYLNQWNSIMRCGRYIRLHIEQPLMGSDGWEAWLETPNDPGIGVYDNRLVDSYLVLAFYLLIAAYYLVTSYVACLYVREKYPDLVAWLAIGVYVGIALLMGVFLLRRVPTRTTSDQERMTKQRFSSPPDAASS